MTSRTITFVAWMCACSSDANPHDLVQGGSLIAIDEGEQRTLHLTASAQIESSDEALQAKIDGNGDLELSPLCTAIMGTSGPPHEFELKLTSNGVTTPVVVEVHPSGAGACEPKVVACLQSVGSGSGNVTGHAPCSSPELKLARACTVTDGLITDSRIAIDFGSASGSGVGSGHFSDPNRLDQALTFSFTNPGCPDPGDPKTCDPLNLAVTTEAPIFVAKMPGATEFCSDVPNMNVIDEFDLVYSIIRGSDASAPVVSSGGYRIVWNRGSDPEPYGADVEWCAAEGVAADACTPFRSLGTTQWCINKKQPGAALSVGLRIWASPDPAPGDHPYDITAKAGWVGGGGPTIFLVAEPRRAPDALMFPSKPTLIPLDMTLEAGTVDDGTIDFQLRGSASSGAQIGSAYTQTFERSIRVHIGSAGDSCP